MTPAASDYDAFLCGRGEERIGVDCAALEAAGFATDGSDLNLPSIAINELVGEQVIRRRVTNVGAAAQFIASVEAPTTIDVDGDAVSALASRGRDRGRGDPADD